MLFMFERLSQRITDVILRNADINKYRIFSSPQNKVKQAVLCSGTECYLVNVIAVALDVAPFPNGFRNHLPVL